MPTINKTKRRPWEPKPKPHQKQGGRTQDTNFYNSRQWRKLRASFLADNPLCKECENENKVTTATIADHIIPIRQGGEPLDTANLQPLCEHHHAVKSAKERWGK